MTTIIVMRTGVEAYDCIRLPFRARRRVGTPDRAALVERQLKLLVRIRQQCCCGTCWRATLSWGLVD